MSEKIRRINKKPLQIPPRVKAVFYVGVGIIVILIAVFFIYKNISIFKFIGKNGGDTNTTNAAAGGLYAVLCRNENCFSLDKNGMTYADAGRMSGNLILTLEDKTERNIKLGDKFLGSEALAKLYFIKTSISRDLAIGLASVQTHDPNREDFDFITNQNWIVRVTLRENAYKTMETLKRTLEQISPSNIPLLEYVDLRISNKVYYKFR
ncbi:MAG: hypothetical protein AAB911_01790 [Patescibacteria group bacterium]|mgnify:CR=1 FL=1